MKYRQIFLATVLNILLLGQVLSTKICIKYPSLVEDLQDTKKYYCGSAINWPVEVEVAYDLTLHQKAFDIYKKAYAEYFKNRDNKKVGLSADCLGVLRKSACSKFFPFCVQSDSTSKPVYLDSEDKTLVQEKGNSTITAFIGEGKEGVCKSLCMFVDANCSSEMPELNEELCDIVRNSECARSGTLILVFGIALLTNLIF